MNAKESATSRTAAPLVEDPREIDAALTEWFKQAGRTLNFRETRDPYAIMVSEFMLQQTTVAAVEPFFERFMKKYPTVDDLARADESDVLASWAGLGYYRRARQLHAAATELAGRDGTFPRAVGDLIKLPGIGRYTAGAISSQAFDLPAPILEANTVRVFARLTNNHGVTGERMFTKQLWAIADYLVSKSRSPRKFNIAAMELGALVCRPQPLCEKCPVADYCRAFQAGTASETPLMPPRRESISVNQLTLVIEHEDRFAVEQIPQGEWHAGMWQFPTTKIDNSPDPADASSFVHLLLGIPVANIQKLRELRFQVTHHKVTGHVFHCHLDSTTPKTNLESREVTFMTPQHLLELPMGSAHNKLRNNVIQIKGKDDDAN